MQTTPPPRPLWYIQANELERMSERHSESEQKSDGQWEQAVSPAQFVDEFPKVHRSF